MAKSERDRGEGSSAVALEEVQHLVVAAHG
jgi:hypothetical protein